MDIRRLAPADARTFMALRLEALRTEPDAFSSTYEVEATRSTAEVIRRLESSTVLGAWIGDHAVGIGGFKQQAGAKLDHKGFLWGIYVMPAWRRRGIATLLIQRLIAEARQHVEQLTLTVAAGNRGAIALYDRLGFTVYGVEPRSLRTARGYSDEVLMALRV